MIAESPEKPRVKPRSRTRTTDSAGGVFIHPEKEFDINTAKTGDGIPGLKSSYEKSRSKPPEIPAPALNETEVGAETTEFKQARLEFISEDLEKQLAFIEQIPFSEEEAYKAINKICKLERLLRETDKIIG